METEDRDLKDRWRYRFWILLAAMTLLRLALAGRAGLGVDESHYLVYARHPAWGYFDHPPGVLLAALPLRLIGESHFAARLGPILLAVLTLIVWRSWALKTSSPEAAWRGTVFLHLLPLYHLLSLALMPDAVLNLFWCLTLLFFIQALKSGNGGWWLAAGVSGGLAALGKYHGLLLAPCLLGYLVSSKRYRSRLGKTGPYLAALAGAAVFLPNVLWNWSHDWISYRFQLGHGMGGGWSFTFNKFSAALGGQLGVASPIVFGLLAAAVLVLLRKKNKSESDRLLLWTSVPVFGFFILAGSGGKILPHWTFPGWWAGALAAGGVLSERLRDPKRAKRWRRWYRAGAVLALVMVAGMYAGMAFPVLPPLYNAARSASSALNRIVPAVEPLEPFDHNLDITNDLYGWPEAAERVEEIRASMPNPAGTFVFAHRPFTASQLAAELPPETVVATLNPRPDQYLLWFDPAEHSDWDALFVDHDRYRRDYETYLPLFAGGDPEPVEFTAWRGERPAHVFRVYRYYGFRGFRPGRGVRSTSPAR